MQCKSSPIHFGYGSSCQSQALQDARGQVCLQAMHVSFGMAEYYNGICFLRFDDTNPEAEKQEYIEDIVAWLGWKPHKACIQDTCPVLW